jgi:mycothiol synthase
VLLRTFRPGRDDESWLALNALAFADHPEQGKWTAEDLHARMAESWFDPEGFLVAERGGRMVGFHWTKVHGGRRRPDAATHGTTPIGEVYVVGVDPRRRAAASAAALTLAGLHTLRPRGCGRRCSTSRRQRAGAGGATSGSASRAGTST